MPDAPADHFTLWWYRALFCSFHAFIIVLCLTTRLSQVPIITIPMSVVSAVLLVMYARGATVRLSDDEVLIRGLRSRRIAWSSIRRVEAVAGTTMLLPWRVPGFVLEDGSIIRADEIRSLRHGTIVDDVVAAARRRLLWPTP